MPWLLRTAPPPGRTSVIVSRSWTMLNSSTGPKTSSSSKPSKSTIEIERLPFDTASAGLVGAVVRDQRVGVAVAQAMLVLEPGDLLQVRSVVDLVEQPEPVL